MLELLFKCPVIIHNPPGEAEVAIYMFCSTFLEKTHVLVVQRLGLDLSSICNMMCVCVCDIRLC